MTYNIFELKMNEIPLVAGGILNIEQLNREDIVQIIGAGVSGIALVHGPEYLHEWVCGSDKEKWGLPCTLAGMANTGIAYAGSTAVATLIGYHFVVQHQQHAHND